MRLIDFGVAVRRSEAALPQAQGELVGTLAYMAPEQTGRMKRGIDARADLYALGGTLYQMLTGELPFEGTDELSLIHAHIARRPQPPHQRAPERGIPEAVSAIVMKLLDKSPEQRYQTAEGLACDLEHALDMLRQTEQLSAFALGTRDFEDRVRRPSRIFGRERELQALMRAFHNVGRGRVELCLVAGASGVGKSALVGAIQDQVRACQGIVASGKFDPLQRGTPYAALAQALRALVRRSLAGSAGELARWKRLWSAALGPSARIVVDLAPELVQILGEPPELLAVGLAEARHRFQFTVKSFLRATTSAAHPLVLFIDDMQWADAASLSLIEAIVTDPELAHLMLIGAYRSGEVDAASPLHGLAAAAERSGRPALRLSLEPLDAEALTGMVGDLLHCSDAAARSLAALVRAKTAGNPFFSEQFLRVLHDRKLLWRDLETGQWRWEAERLERMEVSDNVAALLSAKIDRLPRPLRRVLTVGACVGASFAASLLSVAAEVDEPTRGPALAALLQEGLLVQAGDEESPEYAFVHDRVRQTAYELLAEPERKELHLLLARTLAARGAAEPGGTELFTLVHHYLRALTLLARQEAAEQCQAAAHFLAAGLQAKQASAYAEALSFLTAGRELVAGLGEAAPRELAFELDLALAVACWLAGQPEAGAQKFAACRQQARSAVDRGRVAKSHAALLLVAGRYQEGLELGLTALAELGWSFPRDPAEMAASFGGQVARVMPWLAEATAQSLRALPPCTDPVARTAAELFPVTVLAATVAQPALAPSQMFALLESAFRHGLSPGSLFALGAAALVFTSVLQTLELGAQCVELTFACQSIPGMLIGKSLVSACLPAQLVHPDLRFVYEQWRDAVEICRREGDITHAETGQSIAPAGQMGAGLPLSRCAIPEPPFRDLMAAELGAAYRATQQLLIRPSVADIGAAVRQIAALPTTSALTTFCTAAAAAFAAVHLGADDQALQLAVEIDALAPAAWCNPPTLWNLKILTILGATLQPADGAKDAARQAAFTAQRAWLAKLAAFNPATFRHALLLVEAGEARSAGRHERAEDLYEQAIQHAAQHGFVNDEALALRLCGESLLSRGRVRMARTYLRDAHDAYLRWEAAAAAAALRAKYPALFPAAETVGAEPGGAAGRAATRSPRTGGGGGEGLLDVVSLLKAAQALSSDRDPDSLLARMLRLLSENAGAERAVLVLAREDQLVVRAEFQVEPERLTLHDEELGADSALVPASAVQYVARGREPLVLGPKTGDEQFAGDPYLKHRRPASLLLVQLLHQGRLLGVMVLEHSRAADAFPEARVEVVALLAAQAAAAVENAVMHKELATSHQRLERLVEQRTAELKAAKEAADAASCAKSDFLSSMSHELRTPLTGILGYAQLLERAPELSPERQNAVRIIRASGEHLLTLINDVLDMAKVEAGKLELLPREMHFRMFVRTVLGICQPRAEAKGLTFQLTEGGAALSVVRADQKRLMQVLLNLLGNAIKFTERGRVGLHIQVADAPAGSPRPVCFRVEDTGPGIAPEHLQQIFKPFEQAGTPAARSEGTGLGLAITKKLVELMGGTLHVRSQLGRGSAFEVEIPLMEGSHARPAAPEASPLARVTGYEGARRTLLVVDDRADNRAVFRDLLVPLGFAVIEAAGGEDALKLALTQRPDVILMDLAMPGLDGYETTRRLRRLPELAGVIVLACSASISERERERSARVGCNDFLPKPVALDALLHKLTEWLGLTWQCAEPGPGADAATAALTPPPADVLARLRELSSRGRMSALLKELDRLRQEDTQHGPFLERLRELAVACQTEKIREFLGQAAAS